MAGCVATIAVSAFPQGIDNTQRLQILRGTVTLDGGDYAPGGIALSFPEASTPIDVRFYGKSGYIYIWNAASNKLLIFAEAASLSSNGPLPEYATAAVNTLIRNDDIRFVAYFVRA